MNYRGVLFLLGRLQLALAVALALPAGAAVYVGGGEAGAFFAAAGLAALGGVLCSWLFRQRGEFAIGRREAFLLVSAAWILASCYGALPYVFVKGARFAVDALFESASGFTTTGASVLADVEHEPVALLLWRSLTQWLGGMGIIVLGIAILPKLAVGGMQLLGAEAPGPTTEKLTPRIAQTAKALWGVYALLTLLEALALWALGMAPLEALDHSMTTMATGGFSTRNASIAAFHSPAIEVVITLFMVLAGANFALHFHLLRGKPSRLWRDAEFRLYVWILTAATALLTVDLMVQRFEGDLVTALRHGAFQATSIMTTTGYATADFDAWPSFSRALLLVLMFVGGCAGSTGGSVKVVRVMIIAKKLAVELRRLVQPRAVLPVRVGRQAIPEEVVTSVTTFFILFLTLVVAGGLILAMTGLNPVSAFSGAATCLGNIGPGFGVVGPTSTFASLTPAAKLTLVVLMIVGRLELYTVLVTLFLFRRR